MGGGEANLHPVNGHSKKRTGTGEDKRRGQCCGASQTLGRFIRGGKDFLTRKKDTVGKRNKGLPPTNRTKRVV